MTTRTLRVMRWVVIIIIIVSISFFLTVITDQLPKKRFQPHPLPKELTLMITDSAKRAEDSLFQLRMRRYDTLIQNQTEMIQRQNKLIKELEKMLNKKD